MASFRKRSGSWTATIDKKGFNRIYRTFNTKTEAETWARHLENEMDRGVFVSRKEAEATTLSEALDRYLREVSVLKKSHRTEKIYAATWKKVFGPRSLASITSTDIAKYRDDRLIEVSPNMVRLELALLSHLFTIAIKEWGMTGLVNPVLQIRKPKLPKGRERRLLPGEIERILAATESPLLSSVILFALETAMRREEIAKMEWKHVNNKQMTLTIPDTKNTETRVIPLSAEAVRILSGLPLRIDGKVWGISPDSITQAFSRTISRARDVYEKECEEKKEKSDPAFCYNLHFHDLRHEATSLLFELGLSTEEAKHITGHKDYRMLARYTHLKPEVIGEKLARLKKERERKQDGERAFDK